jgi:hypothetical protein
VSFKRYSKKQIGRKRLLLFEEKVARITLEILLYLEMYSGTVEE